MSAPPQRFPRLPELDGAHRAALGRAVTLLQHPPLPGQSFATSAIAAVGALVPGHLVAFNAHRGEEVLQTHSNLESASAIAQATVDPFEDLYSSHPAARARAAGHLVEVATASDFAGLRTFRATALHALVYRPLGVDRQLFCFFPVGEGGADGRVYSMTSMRAGRDYAGPERAAMAALRPHLRAALLAASAAAGLGHPPLRPSDALGQAAAALDETGRPLLVTDGAGRVHYHTPAAGALLASLAAAEGEARDHHLARGPRLPASARAWLRDCLAGARAAQAGHFSPPAKPLEVGRWRLRLAGVDLAADRFRLFIERLAPPRERAARLALALGLSGRQAEVLFWAAQGKTNPEIAVILGVERSTVRKHLEHVFGRLHLENRLAAAALVNQVLPLG